jgi:hypothetical protein
MRAAPSPVTLVVDSGLNRYCFKSLETLSHVETLVLDNIHDDDQGRWVVPDSLRHNPYFPRMELPGLKVINVVGEYLPAKYILTCLNALYNSKLPSISLGMRSYETIDLVALVSLPIFRSIHSITIATGESAIYFVQERPNKSPQPLLLRRFFQIMTTCLSSRP